MIDSFCTICSIIDSGHGSRWMSWRDFVDPCIRMGSSNSSLINFSRYDVSDSLEILAHGCLHSRSQGRHHFYFLQACSHYYSEHFRRNRQQMDLNRNWSRWIYLFRIIEHYHYWQVVGCYLCRWRNHRRCCCLSRRLDLRSRIHHHYYLPWRRYLLARLLRNFQSLRMGRYFCYHFVVTALMLRRTGPPSHQLPPPYSATLVALGSALLVYCLYHQNSTEQISHQFLLAWLARDWQQLVAVAAAIVVALVRCWQPWNRINYPTALQMVLVAFILQQLVSATLTAWQATRASSVVASSSYLSDYIHMFPFSSEYSDFDCCFWANHVIPFLG